MPGLEDALRQALQEQPLPGPEVRARLRRSAVEALPQPSRRGVSLRTFLGRRRAGALAVAGALVLAGSALAAALLTSGTSPDPRIGSFVDPASEARFQSIPALADSPWPSGPGGGAYATRIDQVPPRPSLAFPPGTTYAEAVQAFYDAVSRRGELPPGARLAAPLPAGKVAALPADASMGVAIDLRAPFGYAVPSGVIRPPEIARTAGAPIFPRAGEHGLELPVGVRLRAPALLACQVVRADAAGAPCRLTALPPGSPRAASGATALPDVTGLSLADALDELVRSGLGLYGEAGWVTVWSADEHARLLADGALLEAGDDPPTVAEFQELGLEAFLRHPLGPGGRGLLLPPGESALPGRVVAQHPPPGASLRRGTPVAVAATGDAACGGPAACAPGTVPGSPGPSTGSGRRRRTPSTPTPSRGRRSAFPPAPDTSTRFGRSWPSSWPGASCPPPRPWARHYRRAWCCGRGAAARRWTCARPSDTTPRPGSSRRPPCARCGARPPRRCARTCGPGGRRSWRRSWDPSTSSGPRSPTAR
jgi:hypothetical protein